MTELILERSESAGILSYALWRGEEMLFTADNFHSTRVFLNWDANPLIEKAEFFKDACDFYHALRDGSAPEVPMHSMHGCGVIFNSLEYGPNQKFDASLDDLAKGETIHPGNDCTSSTICMPYGIAKLIHNQPIGPLSSVGLMPQFVTDIVIQATAEYMASTLAEQATPAELRPYIAQVCLQS